MTLKERLIELNPNADITEPLTPAQVDAVFTTLSAEQDDPPEYGVLTSAELLAWSGANGRSARVEKAANDTEMDDILRSVAITADKTISRDNTTLDLNKADRMAMIDALVVMTVLTADDKVELLVMARAADKPAPVKHWPGLSVEKINRAWGVELPSPEPETE